MSATERLEGAEAGPGVDGVGGAVVDMAEDSPPAPPLPPPLPHSSAVDSSRGQEASGADAVRGAGAMPSSAGGAARVSQDDARRDTSASLPHHQEISTNAPEDAAAAAPPTVGQAEPDPDWDALCQKMAATPAMARRRTELVVKLDRIVKGFVGRNARIEVFGSSVCGFDTVHSDVDLTISIGGMPMASADQSDLLKRLSKALRFQHGMQSYALVTARIPIIKLTDPATGISADLSVQNDMPVYRSLLLHEYTRIDDRLRPLVILAKSWAKARGISNAPCGFLNSFGYSMLVIYYLQSVEPPILPRLHDAVIPLRGDALRRAKERGQAESEGLPKHSQGTANGVTVHHAVSTRLGGWGRDNGSSLGQLVAGFFEFFATKVDLKERVVCIRSASPPQRVDGDPNPAGAHNNFMMLDPMDPSDNVARVVHLAAADRICEEFRRWVGAG